MSTQHLGYIGGGVLVAIVVVTLLGVPPELWISAVLIAAVVGAVGLAVLVHQAQADGSDVAQRFVAGLPIGKPASDAPESVAVEQASDVEVELVRAADDSTDTPAVWLHRKGGRRVHRFRTEAGWTVERVSTKDPDNPRKRVIGESLVLGSEANAVAAANDLARGLAPSTDEPALDARMTAGARA
jgi:hypothetical protein